MAWWSFQEFLTFLGRKASLNHTEPIQPNAFTNYEVLRALCASGCSQDYTGLIVSGLLSCSAGSANALGLPIAWFL